MNETSLQDLANRFLIDAIMRSNSLMEVDFALALGAEVNALIPISLVNKGVQYEVGVYPLHGALNRAGTSPHIIARLIEKGAITAYNPVLHTAGPIHMAALQSPPEVLRLFIDAKADLNVPDSDDVVPLVYAIISKSPEKIKMLLDAKADVNYGGLRSVNLPLIEAVKTGITELVYLVVDKEYGTNVDIQDFEGNTALHHLARMDGAFTATRAILEQNPNLDIRNIYMQTPLITAILNGKTEKAKMFLNAGADPNLTGPNGASPLMFAISKGNIGLALFIIEKGAELSQKDILGLDAADYAAFTKNLALLDIIRNKQGRTLLAQNPVPKEATPDAKKKIA